MAYQLTADIDDTRELNVKEFDEAMQLCLNRLSVAFSKLNGHSPTFNTLMETLFQSFARTHKSIRVLLKQTEEDLNFASDAMSLVREQVEKVFIVALMLDEPAKWIEVYFKDDWRRLYKHEILINVEERKNLPRFHEANIETEQVYENMRTISGVSAQEKELIIHKHNSPNTPKPAHLAGVDLPMFPMPKGTIDAVSEADLKQFLLRWHKEYEFICGYSHVGADKMFVNTLLQSQSMTDAEKRTAIEREVIFNTVILSYLAMASACSIAWKYLLKHSISIENSAEFLDAIMKFWDEMKQSSLLGIVLWEIYVKGAFPPIIGK
jgi:hypothetical protein